MKKLKNSEGFSLIETMAALFIVVLLIVAMGTGMSSATKIYNEAIYASDCNALANVLNTAISDILRYAQTVRKPMPNKPFVDRAGEHFVNQEGTIVTLDGQEYVFTSMDYGIQDAYFYIAYRDADGDGIPENDPIGRLQLKSLRKDITMDLVNGGIYPDLNITDFHADYVEKSDSKAGGYFDIRYKIVSDTYTDRVKQVQFCVRVLNG